MAVPKEERLILFDFDDEEDDIVSEQTLSEEQSQGFDVIEIASTSVEASEDMGDEIHNSLDTFGENISSFVNSQYSQDSLETPVENWYIPSDEEQDENDPERNIFEEQSPVTHDDENANTEEIVGDTRSQVGNILEKIEGDINKTLHIKRKHMEIYVKDTFESSNRKLKQVLKMNKLERKKINSKFCKHYITTFQKFDKGVQKFNEEQEKSANNYQKQQKAFKLSTNSQDQALQRIREMHEKFIKGLMNLETKSYNSLLEADSELRKEMSVFKRNLMKHTLKYSLD